MITLDFETRGVADLPKVGQRRYALDVSTQALCLCWQFDEEPIDGPVHLWHRGHDWVEKDGPDDELIRRIRDGEPVEAHNAGFEFNIWNEAFTREFPEWDVKLKVEQMHCSAAKASCVSLPRGLEDAIQAVGLRHHKIADGKRLINKLSKPMARRGKNKGDGVIIFCDEEDEHRRNWEYCKGDVRAERGLSEFCPDMSEREREYWLMDFRMNLRGIRLDRKAAKIGLDLAKLEAERLNGELRDITGGAVEKGSQRAALLGWVNGRLVELGEDAIPNTKADTLSFKLDGVPTKAGDEARDAAHGTMREKWETLGEEGARVERAMRICMEVNRSSVAKYKRMLQSVCPDDRLHDIMLYNGADRTGRWSGKNVQPHNFVRGYMKDMSDAWDDIATLDTDYITMLWGEPMVCLAKACRGALIASPGKELYAADFNAIEARKLAWLSGCASMLEKFVPGQDIYCDMASGIYGRPITKADKTERQLGKKAILGLGYAMGWEKFQATVYMDEGIWLEDEFCQMIVRVYRKDKYPEVPMLWRSAEKAAIAAVTEGGEHFCGGGIETVTLSESDAAWAIEVGTRRTRSSRAIGINRNKYKGTVNYDEQEGLRRDIYGAAAELAFCRSRGLEWPAHVDTYKSVPDVFPNWEIQCGGAPSYNLIWRDDQNSRDRNYVLVTTVKNTLDPEDAFDFRFNMRGYWPGSKVPKAEWRNDKRIGAGNAKIPQEALTPFEGGGKPGSVSYFMSDDGNFLHCRLPSGRLLAYLYPRVNMRVTYRFAALNERGKPTTVNFPAKKNVPQHRVRWHAEKLAEKQRKKLLPDPPESFVSPHLSFMGRDTYTKQWKRCGTHGGSLVENYDQASSRDLLAEAMDRVDKMDMFELLLSIHDEVIAEAAKGTCAVKDFEAIMSEVPIWAPGMPITAEGWVGPRLRK